MTKINNKYFLIILIVFTQNCFSQSDFRKGFIVKANNDTVQGWIDYSSAKLNSEICSFQKDSKTKVVSYTPDELNSYAFDEGKNYSSKVVTFKDSVETFFLENLVSGKINLYYLNLERYFVEKDSVFCELKNTTEIIVIGGKKYITPPAYIGILRYLMSDVDSYVERIDVTEFNHNSFMQLVIDYHKKICSNKNCIVYIKKGSKVDDRKWIFSYGFSMDLFFSELSLNNTIVEELFAGVAPIFTINETNANFKSKIFAASPSLFLNLSRNSRSSFQLELRYENFSSQQFEFCQLKMPIKYYFEFMHYNSLKPYFCVGLGPIIDLKKSTPNNIYVNYERLDAAEYVPAHTITTYNGVNQHFVFVPQSLINKVYSTHIDQFDGANLKNNDFGINTCFGIGMKYVLPNHNLFKTEFKLETNASSYSFQLRGGANIISKLANRMFSFSLGYIFL